MCVGLFSRHAPNNSNPQPLLVMKASPNPTIGTAECMNSVRSCARVGAPPSRASPVAPAFEPQPVTPLPPEICAASASAVFADEDTSRTQAGGRRQATPWLMDAPARNDRRRLGAPQPRDSERAALLWRVEERHEEGPASKLVRDTRGNTGGIVSIIREHSAVGRFVEHCEKVPRLRLRPRIRVGRQLITTTT